MSARLRRAALNRSSSQRQDRLLRVRYPAGMKLFTFRARRRNLLVQTAVLALLASACSTAQVPQLPASAAVVEVPMVSPPHQLSVADLAERLAILAPLADPAVLRIAVKAQHCAVASGTVAQPRRLAVIDYSLPSTSPRMWVFELDEPKLLHTEHVAHGKHTGENLAREFSNVEGSLQTSLGLFSAAETYIGENGISLRMDGLEPGINDRARERLLVIHGADYVDPVQALRQGRLGRSYGCPALRRAVAGKVIDSLKEGQLVFAYYPDMEWLDSSRFLNCDAGAAIARG